MLQSLDLHKIENLPLQDKKTLGTLLTPKITKYTPHMPTPKQTAFLLLNNKEAFYGGSCGGGKMLALDTDIMTREGWKTIGTLQESDKILALDGTWTEIEYITPEKSSAINYKLNFSDGSSISCDGEHLWTMEELSLRYRQHKHFTECVEKTLTTQEIIDTGLFMKRDGKPAKRWRLPEFKGIIGEELPFEIPPYILGYWLGDGTSSRGEFTVASKDFPNFEKHCSLNSCEIGRKTLGKSNTYSIMIQGLTTKLHNANLLQNKHIPIEYFYGSRKQRIELLQGLMDSDGYIQKRGRAEWGQKVERQELFDQVVSLICSLGYKVSTTIANSSYRGTSFPSNRVTFTPREEVVTLERKKNNLKQTEAKRSDSAIYLESYEILPNVGMKCVRIKHPSHVFLITKRFLPTHNSDALLMAGLQYVDIKGYAGIIFRKSYADLVKPGALIDRAKEWLFRFPDVKWVDKEKKFEFLKKYGPHTELWSILQFGYMENDNDRFNYQGGETLCA